MSWLDALLGRVFSRGQEIELAGGLDFRSPFRAVRNARTNRIEVLADPDDVLLAAEDDDAAVFVLRGGAYDTTAATFTRGAYDKIDTVDVDADVGEGWVTLWSETRLALAPTDGDARDIRHHLAVAGDEAIDIASMVWQYQRTDDGVLGDAIVNKDAEELAPDGTTGVEWELTLPVADSTIATRAIRIADDVAVQAQAHATIDRVVTIRTYYGPIVNGPYEIGVSI